MRCSYFGGVALMLFLASSTWAAKMAPSPDPALLACIDSAATTYRISPDLLRGIAKVESGFNPAALGCDPDGGCGKGVMQIRYDLQGLAQHGVAPSELWDPCKNVYLGAWALANCFLRFGVTWDGVGCYNAKSPAKRREYAWRVYMAVNGLQRQARR